MDREAAVIRSEMSHTRADLDRKLGLLQERAREMTPRRYVQRHMPEYPVERAAGALLTLAGLFMAWRMYQGRVRRRAQVRAAMESYGRW
jgi:hypothetical protein